jgi:putative SOS response-associated peptidase YedK
MCGRFALTGDLDFYRGYYSIDEAEIDPLAPSWNLAPTDEAYVVREGKRGRRLDRMTWGIVPPWDARTIHINARLETVARKPAFVPSFRSRRALVPADGFYEWEPRERGGTPHWVYRADGFPMTFAGIWSPWRDPATGEWERRFAIVTTRAEGVIGRIHDRMPLILGEESWEAWLDPALDHPEEVKALGLPSDLVMEHEVSKAVNSVRNNRPELTSPRTDTLF